MLESLKPCCYPTCREEALCLETRLHSLVHKEGFEGLEYLWFDQAPFSADIELNANCFLTVTRYTNQNSTYSSRIEYSSCCMLEPWVCIIHTGTRCRMLSWQHVTTVMTLCVTKMATVAEPIVRRNRPGTKAKVKVI